MSISPIGNNEENREIEKNQSPEEKKIEGVKERSLTERRATPPAISLRGRLNALEIPIEKVQIEVEQFEQDHPGASGVQIEEAAKRIKATYEETLRSSPGTTEESRSTASSPSSVRGSSYVFGENPKVSAFSEKLGRELGNRRPQIEASVNAIRANKETLQGALKENSSTEEIKAGLKAARALLNNKNNIYDQEDLQEYVRIAGRRLQESRIGKEVPTRSREGSSNLIRELKSSLTRVGSFADHKNTNDITTGIGEYFKTLVTNKKTYLSKEEVSELKDFATLELRKAKESLESSLQIVEQNLKSAWRGSTKEKLGQEKKSLEDALERVSSSLSNLDTDLSRVGFEENLDKAEEVAQWLLLRDIPAQRSAHQGVEGLILDSPPPSFSSKLGVTFIPLPGDKVFISQEDITSLLNRAPSLDRSYFNEANPGASL